MIRIAIAGGIGSGKSAVTAVLRELGAKVVVADEVNAELLCDPSYIRIIENTFPTVVHNRVINKKELANCIYSDESKRRALMDIAHPLIMQRMLGAYSDAAVVFYEIPLLSEIDFSFDKVWYVDCDIAIRVQRVAKRDGLDLDRVERIIALQKGEDKIRQKADLVIDNRWDLVALRATVKAQYYSILSELS